MFGQCYFFSCTLRALWGSLLGSVPQARLRPDGYVFRGCVALELLAPLLRPRLAPSSAPAKDAVPIYVPDNDRAFGRFRASHTAVYLRQLADPASFQVIWASQTVPAQYYCAAASTLRMRRASNAGRASAVGTSNCYQFTTSFVTVLPAEVQVEEKLSPDQSSRSTMLLLSIQQAYFR